MNISVSISGCQIMHLYLFYNFQIKNGGVQIESQL